MCIRDRNLGDLFVIRAAGNVADAVELGSIEYAVEHLGSTLLVVPVSYTHLDVYKRQDSSAKQPALATRSAEVAN